MSRLNYDRADQSSILAFGKRLQGSCIAALVEVDKLTRLTGRDKGEYGKLLESVYFEISPGNSKEPDFPEAGLELKVSPLIKQKIAFNVKERMKLSMLNYREIASESWSTNSLMKKNGCLLMVFFWHVDEQSPFELKVDHVDIWKFPEEDLQLIKQDWEKIVSIIHSGHAGSLSQSDTLILEAATAGAGKEKDYPKDSFGMDVKVRSLSLKPRYIKFVYDRLIGKLKQSDLEPIVKTWRGQKKTFEQIVVEKASRFMGKTFDQICRSFGVDPAAGGKGKFAAITRKMLDVEGEKIEEFEKMGLMIRTIRLKTDGMPKESVSFPYFHFQKIVDETWESSTLRDILTHRFLLILFQIDGKDLLFKGLRFWRMPEEILDTEVQRVWKLTISRIKEDLCDQLPGIKEGPVVHVRPHARDSEDTDIGLFKRKFPKQSFWISASYLKKELGR